jgi:hypothetical protein
MKQIAILHGAGYVGGELIRLTLGHPDVSLQTVTSRAFAGGPPVRFEAATDSWRLYGIGLGLKLRPQQAGFAQAGEAIRRWRTKPDEPTAYVEGRLQTRKWQGKDGNDRYSTEIVANDMQMLDSRGGGGGSGNWDDSGAERGGGRAPAGGRRQTVPDDLDDDIPF